MDPAIRKALTGLVLSIAVLMLGFTAFDLGSGVVSTALWLNLGAWCLVILCCSWILIAGRRNGEASEGTSDDD